MLIYLRCRLRAAVAVRAFEIEGSVTLCSQKVHVNEVPPFIGLVV
jgi:hypothetical protein